MRKGNVIGQAPEARAASSVQSTYAGTLTRCTGMTIIHGHIIVNAAASAQTRVLDDSIDWRDRLLTFFALAPSSEGGVPNLDPYKCIPSNGSSGAHGLNGEIFLSTGGWDGSANPATPGLTPPQNFAGMRDLSTGNIGDAVIFFADIATGALKVRLKQGEDRGLTYQIFATEQLGYQSTVA